MNSSHRLVLGLVHHEDESRTQSQRRQATLLEQSLSEAGFQPRMVEEFRQHLGDPGDGWMLGTRLAVFRRLWAQEMHHLVEIRRRKRVSLRIPCRKKKQAVGRVLSVIRHRDSLVNTFRRLEIEAALTLKHYKIWDAVIASDAVGAVMVEDDFFLRRETSPADLAELVGSEWSRYDLIDLAGGLTREALGLGESPDQDLSLPFVVANTTCGYFISRRACERLVEMVRHRDNYLYLAPDFLITELNAVGFEGSTLLPHDLPLRHGSRDGTLGSSIPYT